MIDYKISYLASVFINAQEVQPTSQHIAKLMPLFVDKELLPNILLGMLRLQTSNGEWVVAFLPDRISISKNPTGIKGENMGDVLSFCNEVVEIIDRIFKIYPRIPYRVGFVSRYLLEEMSETQLDNIYKALFKSSDFYNDNIPYEWHRRLVAKSNKPFLGREETFNFITAINRVHGDIDLPDFNNTFDRIEVSVDINSHQSNLNERFNSENMTFFYQNVPNWHYDLLNETIKFVEPCMK